MQNPTPTSDCTPPRLNGHAQVQISQTPSIISVDNGLTLEIGEHSYIHDHKIRNPSGARTRVTIGKFCSIATELTVIGYDHHSDWITTFPFLDDANRAKWPGTEGIPYPDGPEHGSNKNRGDIRIGNDVWIGYDVKLFKGVTLGDGAVVGACSLVNKSVEPYTIVAGIPARPIRKRFSDQEIAFLQTIRWWDWPAELINRHMSLLCGHDFAQLEQSLEADSDYQKIRNKARAEQYLCLADTAYANNDFAAACNALKQGLAICPDALSMVVCLGNLQFQLGAYADALQSFKHAAQVKPGDLDIIVRLSNAALRCGDAGLFEQTLKQALKLEPRNPDALRLAINHDIEAGRFAEAAQPCCLLIASNPNDLLLLLQLGKCLREVKDLDSARWCYERALTVDPACSIACEALQRLNNQHLCLTSQFTQPEAFSLEAAEIRL